MVSEFLPIKVVLPDPDRRRPNQPGGSEPKFFGEVTEERRQELLAEIDAVATALDQSRRLRPNIPDVARVALKTEALAKSHRPEEMFRQSCPIIGAASAGSLFISVTNDGLGALRDRVRRARTKRAEASISTIDSIAPVSVDERIHVSDEQVNRLGAPLKVRLFDHQNDQLNRRINDDYFAYLADLQLRASEVVYAQDLKLIIVHAPGSEPIPLQAVAAHPGVRSASFVPQYLPLLHHSLPVPGMSVPFLQPRQDVEYPTIAIVDSGIDPQCAPLQPWLVATETYITPADFDPRHGTFVAGLATFGEQINGRQIAELGQPCRILDVRVMPGGDQGLSEDALVAALQDAVPRHSDVKVWNLSLGSNDPCPPDTFSDLAHALDEIQATHKVQFVVAAGNYIDQARPWPPDAAQGIGDADRIGAPADSVVAVTVGSVAHVEKVGSVVRIDEPSPFSRRGPGPAYTVKPEIVHYGGNCDPAFDYAGTGIRSVDQYGGIAEDVGTSFATPLTSALLANVLHEVHPRPSFNLARALLIHSADHRHDRATSDIEYFGFGRPQGLGAVLHSSPHSATMVFEDTIEPHSFIDLDPFPYPDCLIRNGRSRGTVKMTLVYTPPLDSSFGMEYCRANIEASLGTYSLNRNTGELKYTPRVPADPQISGAMYETDLIKYGHKWCPVKSYRANLKRVASDRWRLFVRLLHRAGVAEAPLSFALVITITGEPGEPVYNDVVAALRYNAIGTEDLALRSEVRQRLQENS